MIRKSSHVWWYYEHQYDNLCAYREYHHHTKTGKNKNRNQKKNNSNHMQQQQLWQQHKHRLPQRQLVMNSPLFNWPDPVIRCAQRMTGECPREHSDPVAAGGTDIPGVGSWCFDNKVDTRTMQNAPAASICKWWECEKVATVNRKQKKPECWGSNLQAAGFTLLLGFFGSKHNWGRRTPFRSDLCSAMHILSILWISHHLMCLYLYQNIYTYH